MFILIFYTVSLEPKKKKEEKIFKKERFLLFSKSTINVKLVN